MPDKQQCTPDSPRDHRDRSPVGKSPKWPFVTDTATSCPKNMNVAHQETYLVPAARAAQMSPTEAVPRHPT